MSLMLAVQSKTVASTPVDAIESLTEQGWWFEPKWDGVRCIAACSREGVSLMNRRGDLITDRFPDVADELRGIGGDEPITLDGEIVVFGSGGKPDFNLLAKRKVGNAKAKALAERIPAHFVAFDLLEIGAHDYRESPYITRRTVLESELTDRVMLSPRTEDGSALWNFILQQELEGIVGKHPYAPWVPNRSDRWVKFRRTNTVSCLVTGIQPGKGKHTGLMGALELSMIEYGPDKRWEPVPVGKVGTGFTDKQRKDLVNAVGLIVEVEYQEVTPDGVLRFPSFKGVRTDLDVEDCVLSQLTHMGGEA